MELKTGGDNQRIMFCVQLQNLKGGDIGVRLWNRSGHKWVSSIFNYMKGNTPGGVALIKWGCKSRWSTHTVTTITQTYLTVVWLLNLWCSAISYNIHHRPRWMIVWHRAAFRKMSQIEHHYREPIASIVYESSKQKKTSAITSIR